MGFTGFCNKERPQVGVIVVTKEPAEREGIPAIGKRLPGSPLTKSYLQPQRGSGVPSLLQAWLSHMPHLSMRNLRYHLKISCQVRF